MIYFTYRQKKNEEEEKSSMTTRKNKYANLTLLNLNCVITVDW